MIVIGEKLNGAIPAVAKAILDRDAETIQKRALSQAEAGSDYLDVAAGVANAAEKDALIWLIETVQEAVDTPLCVDSPDPAAIVAALPYCKRAGIVNSVSFDRRKLDVILPAIKDTGWGCIALLEKDGSVPDSADGRMEAFDGILAAAKAYGIAEDRLFIDPLVTTLSTNGKTFEVFGDCCKRIRARSKRVHITSGLSNVSFGLPNRTGVNIAFLAMAMASGMDSAILDPLNKELAAVRFAADALLGNDEYCENYLEAFRTGLFGKAENTRKRSNKMAQIEDVYSAVLGGRIKEAPQLVEAALKDGTDPNTILNDGMIAAMGVIGTKYQNGEIFMPEMLMAARAMQKGVLALKPYLLSGEVAARGKVIIGTVAGDMHDIGKNLVGLMMESAGFEIVDLGTDVSADGFIAAIRQNPDAKIVGLSTLLTTTLPAMRDIVSELKKAASCRIMVGGAPVTQEFAAEIGADGYSADAAAAVDCAKALLA